MTPLDALFFLLSGHSKHHKILPDVDSLWVSLGLYHHRAAPPVDYALTCIDEGSRALRGASGAQGPFCSKESTGLALASQMEGLASV